MRFITRFDRGFVLLFVVVVVFWGGGWNNWELENVLLSDLVSIRHIVTSKYIRHVMCGFSFYLSCCLSFHHNYHLVISSSSKLAQTIENILQDCCSFKFSFKFFVSVIIHQLGFSPGVTPGITPILLTHMHIQTYTHICTRRSCHNACTKFDI